MLDSEYRYGHRLYLRYYSDSAIPNSRHGNENLCLHRCSRFSGIVLLPAKYLSGQSSDGSRVLANVAGIMAACYGRPRQIHQSGSALLTMAIAGGAVIPTVFGFLQEGLGAQGAYWLALPCFLFILYYGVAGYKIRTK